MANLHKAYGTDGGAFLASVNPDTQKWCAANIDRAYNGTAPTLTAVSTAYSQRLLHVWIMAQLENLNMTCGVREKMSAPQMKEVAELMELEYPYLKVTEIMLFLHRFKCGTYGEFYGVVDPLRVMNALREFMKQRTQERYELHVKAQQEQKRADDEYRATHSLSRQEYEQLKNTQPQCDTQSQE